MRLPRRSRRRRVLGALSVVIVLFLVLTAVLFVFPSTNAPRRSSAIVVLGGSGLRVPAGLALAHAGFAPYLVISDSPNSPCPADFGGVTVSCFHPHPATTQGEARATAKLARRHHWSRIIIVSGIAQTTRARIRLRRCYSGTLLFDPVSPGGLLAWIHSVLYEWAALTKALTLQRGC
jgi:uncharacterized SAM-binding protein YcdF (DUF218 family)